MDYHRIYREFIADRKARQAALSGYTEKHHIVPRSLGGGDESSNLVSLTAEDHFFAHLLLARAHGGRQWYALFVMMRGADRQRDEGYLRRARRHYARARTEFISRHGPRMRAVRTGATHSDTTRAKISAAALGKPKSAEAVEKMRAALKGRKLSPEHARKVSANVVNSPRFAGHSHSEDTKARMSAVNQARKIYASLVEGADIRKVTIAQMRDVGIII